MSTLQDLSIQKIVQTLLAPRFYRRVRFDEDSPTFVPIAKSVILEKAQEKVNADVAQAQAAAADRLRQAEEQASKDVQAYEVALERMRPVGTDAEVCATRDAMTDAERASCEEYMPPKVAVTYARVTYDEEDEEEDELYAIVRIEDAPGQQYLKDMIFNKQYAPEWLAREHWSAGHLGVYADADIESQLHTLGYNKSSLGTSGQFQLEPDAERVFRNIFRSASRVDILHGSTTMWEWMGRDAKRQRTM